MADEKDQIRELAEAAAQAQRDLAAFGRVTQQTQDMVTDAQMKAKYGVENFTAGTKKGADAIGALASAGMAAGKAMLDGKKGAAAFNSSLDELTTAAQAAGVALSLLIPGGFLIKGLIAGITLATTAYIKYTKEANEMADKLHSGYVGLQKAGAAAADGMTGLKEDAHKLGLSMNDLDQMVSLVAANSKDLALFAGSVSEGRKKFADLGQAMTPYRRELMNMGMDQKEINEASMGYLKLQSRIGATQNKSTQELADSTKKYLVEQDALTKLTGMTRQEQENAREEIRSQERFAAKLQEMREQGKEKEAKELEDAYLILKSKSKEAAQGFADLSTGMITTEAARKQNMTDQGKSLEQTQKIIAGQQNAAGAAQEVAKASGDTAKRMGTSLAMMGQNNNIMSDYAGSLALGAAAAGDGITKAAERIKADQEKQGKGADGITDKQSQLILTQQKANAAMEDFVFKGIGPAQDKMILLAEASLAAAKALNLIGGETKVNKSPTQDTQLSSAGAKYEASKDEQAAMREALNDPKVSDRDKEWMRQQLKNVEKRAVGGPVQKGKPYLVGEKGPELFVPSMTGDIVPNDVAGIGEDHSERSSKMEKYAKSLLKDTESLTKITDNDLNKTKKFSQLQTKIFEKKTALMEDELELLDEQNEIMEKMVEVAEKAGGPQAAAALKKQLMMARAGMNNMGGGPGLSLGGAAPGMGGGSGLQMPAASPVSGMGGGQGLQVQNQDDLKGLGLKMKSGDVQAEGAKISPKLIELAKAVQSGVPGFNQFTGFNDKFHNEKAPSSKHTQGIAMDFTVAQQPSVEDGKKITDWLKQMGASLAIDEYNNPSGHATAGHFHAQIPAFKDGGLVDEATLSLIGEGGPEAVIPLKDGNVPVSFNGSMGLGDEAMSLFKAMADQTANMAAMMEEMVRAQKNSVDVQTKMLRAQN